MPVLLCVLMALCVGTSAYPQQEHGQPDRVAVGRTEAAQEGAPSDESDSGQEHAKGSKEHGSHEPNLLYRWINFAILVGGLTYVLRKPLAQFFAGRTDSIRKSLDEGRSALLAAEERLRAVEQKLQGFEQEMAVFRASALKEMEEEHARLRKATEQEAEKMMESVRTQMEVAGRQARLELRLHAAEQAIEMAKQFVSGRMDAERQHRLVNQFVEKLGA